jgi:uracil-DNA glycosylase
MSDERTQIHQHILAEMEANCRNLPLCQIPADIVIGQGNLHADIMFIGEAPGEQEALQRIPFVGRAGQLLNKTLAEIGIKREDCYVSNIVKVRPPGNRDPLPEEISAFLPYLIQEIELIQPKLFVTLGRFSMNFFLPEQRISAVHGVLQRFIWEDRIIHLLPQYHPAAALRGNTMMAAFKADMAKLPKALDWIAKKTAEMAEVKRISQIFVNEKES